MTHTRTPVNWLRSFEVAARHLSISAAAAELSVTPAAVSQQIRLLELRMGHKLFIRHARGLRLTPSGEALVPACRESFERLDATIAELFGDRALRPLVVRVSLGFARQWLLGKVAGFSRAHPSVPIRILATVWAADIPDANVDVDVRLAAGPILGMESHQLTQDELFPVCAPALAMRSPRLIRPASILKHPLLTALGFAQGWKHWFAAAELDAIPIARIEFDSIRLALDAAELGHGIALARTSYVEESLRHRRLRAIFSVRLKALDDIYVSVRKGIAVDHPASLFRDWLLARPERQHSRGR